MIKLPHNKKVRALQIINHLLLVGGLVYVFQTNEFYLLFITLIAWWVTGVMGINVGFHRLLSHRSFKTNKLWQILCTLCGVITVVGSPLAWVATHRQHHQTTDEPGDPHSPHLLGNFNAWFGLWGDVKINLKLVKDLRRDDFQRFVHKNYFSIIATYVLALFLINPLYVIFVYAIPACLSFHASTSVVVLGHRHGYRTHDLGTDKSANSWIVSLLTLGEGWHNNHHAKPYAWNNQEKWWEIDVPAMVIRMIKK
jgi:fatty-acid desaturase